jgi:ribosome maturation protein SDO1
MDPGFFMDCDALVRNLQGRLEILAVSVHFEGDTHVDDFNDYEDVPPALPKESADSEVQLSEKIQKQTISEEKKADTLAKQNKCSTCNAFVGDAKQFRDHFKSDWHKHNLKRKTKQLPPLTAEECLADMDLNDSKADLKEYSF